MSLYNEAREEAKSNDGRFSPHVCGQFPGTIEEVKKGEYQGRDLFEIKVRTQYGIARTTIWRTTEKGDLPHLTEKAGGNVDEAKAEIKKRWVRICRLYTDLGCEAPDDEVLLYDNLGMLIGRPCWTVVKENKQDAQNPIVYINAPKKDGTAAKTDAPVPKPSTANPGQPKSDPVYDEVPF